VDEGLGLGPEDVTKADQRVMQARTGRPSRDVEKLRDLDEGEPEVVVQDEDRALLDRKPGERALEGVTIHDADRRVGRRRSLDREYPNVGPPVPGSARLVIAGVDEDAMDPRLEAIGFA
jgi:hypothetical protein